MSDPDRFVLVFAAWLIVILLFCFGLAALLHYEFGL